VRGKTYGNRKTKIDRQQFAQIELPEEIIGICIQKKCNKYTYLGNGYCMECWDKGFGFDSQFPSHYSTKKMGQETIRQNTW